MGAASGVRRGEAERTPHKLRSAQPGRAAALQVSSAAE